MDDFATNRLPRVAGLLILAAIAVAAADPFRARTTEAKDGPGGGKAAGYLSPIAMVANKTQKTIYIAQATAGRVDVFDVATCKVTSSIDIGMTVSGVAISPDGAKLYVTAGGAKGKLFVIDIKNRRVTARIPVGHTPISPVISPDGKTVYVCNQFSNAIGVVDVTAGKQTASIPVIRQPVSADISKDRKTLIVANHLPAGAFRTSFTAAEVSVIDTASRKIVSTIKLHDGSTNLRQVRISPDGKYAALTHRIGRYQLPRTQIERGWANTNMIGVIDIANRTINSIPLDDIDHGAANPWAIAWSADSKTLCVSHADTHEISVINMPSVLAGLARIASEKKVNWVPNDLSFFRKLGRRRVRLAGVGPRSMVIMGSKAYVGEYFTDSLSVVDISPPANPKNKPKVRSVALGPKRGMTTLRRGEMLFNDARMCFQNWLSCASCHPGGRTDGLNWDLMNDGLGNPKSGKSLVWAHKTPPSMITGRIMSREQPTIRTGVDANAKATVRSHIQFVQFAVREEEDVVAICEYLESIKPAPSPVLVGGKLSPAALRGRKVFKTAGCASCHSGALFTDQKKHFVGTAIGLDAKNRTEYDTPTLVEVWRTAPYLSQGQAATILDVLSKEHNPNDHHGKTSNLSKQELADLAEYVMSL